MYTRKFVKGLLIPSFGVGVVHAKGEQDKEDCDDSKKLIRAQDLPLYVDPPKYTARRDKVEDEEGFLITTIRCARQELQQIVGQARMIQSEVQNVAEEVVKETEDAVSFLRQEENLLPRLGAIGLGGFAGYLLAFRKGIIRKTLYSAAGAGLIAAVAYPNQAREYTEEVVCEMKKYAVFGYHFLNGAEVDWKKLETIKPPCFGQKGGELMIQKDEGKHEPDQTGKYEQSSQQSLLVEKDQEKLTDSCKDEIKAPEKSGPIDKRSYTERCRERGACGTVKKKPVGDRTATQCDPGCTGPKRGSRLKQSDSEAKSRTSISEKDKKKCLAPEKRAEQGQQPQQQTCPEGITGSAADQSKPKEQTVDPCKKAPESPPQQQSIDIKTAQENQPQQQAVAACRSAPESQPQQQAVDPCKKAPESQPQQQTGKTTGTTRDPSQPSTNPVDQCPPRDKAGGVPKQSGRSTVEQFNDSAMSLKDSDLPASVDQSIPIESTCQRKRRASWGDSSDAREPRGRRKAGDCKLSPVTGEDTNESRVPNSGSEQCVMSPSQRENESSSDVIQGPAARDPSDHCKSAIKRSSVTVSYANPPSSAESCVVVGPNEKKPCSRSSVRPKEVTMGGQPRRARALGENDPTNPYTQPRQTARSRQRRETQPEMDEP